VSTTETGADRITPTTRITTIISDFGGVLTTPLEGAFKGFTEDSGISLQELGMALGAITAQLGANPIFELETGRLAEAKFNELLERELSSVLGREVAVGVFGQAFFAHLHPNEPMIELMATLHARGYRMGLCTNNVREWESLWRAMLPVDEIFEVIVDSAIVGIRKPDPRIYQITLERLGVNAGEALFVDDMDINCDAAREAGMQAVQFVANEQAIAEIESLLGDLVA
jgi:putative hydrolase of the HAD superfamily